MHGDTAMRGDSGDHVLARVRRAGRAGAGPDPTLLADLAYLDTTTELVEAGRLLARVPTDLITPPGRTLRPLRVAVTASFTAESVAPLLRVRLLRAGVAPELHVVGFDQTGVELRDPDSALARFLPEVTLCLLDDRSFLPAEWDPTAPGDLRPVLGERLAALGSGVAAFAARTSGVVLLHTVPLPASEHARVVGYRAKAELGRVWRELNTGLLELAAADPLVHVLDLETLLVEHAGPLRDERLYRFASMAWSPSAEERYATEAATFCRAVAGPTRKVLVLDLDNTLWGGVLGDDGPAGIQLGGGYPGNCYTAVQRTAAALKLQGVLLATASKNDQALVDEVLAGHVEMTLRPGDFVVQAANWGRKDHSIRRIAETLDLGLDSVVFADDSAFECDLVRRELPEVTVVRLTGDPAGHAAALVRDGHFAVLATTSTDRERTAMYHARAGRQRLAASFESATDYLAGLGLRVTVSAGDKFTLPRVVQLGARTNQFNLVPGAHGEARTHALAASPDHLVLAFEVADRFGREGVVGAVWVAPHPDHWLVENLVMSCRVFARGVEQAVLAYLARRAVAAGAVRLDALHRPGERNGPATTFLRTAGFTAAGETDGVVTYELSLAPGPPAVPFWIDLGEEGEPHHV